MFYQGYVRLVGVKLPEAGIAEVELEAKPGQDLDPREFNTLAKGERFTRKLTGAGDQPRVLVRVRGILRLEWAHVVAETFIGNGLTADNTYRVALQFAVGANDLDLAIQLIMRQGLDGLVALEQRQLDLDLGSAVGTGALRELHRHLADAGDTVSVTVSNA
jgi:hypothetical protein